MVAEKIGGIKEFVENGIWRIHRKRLEGPKSILLKVARIFILSVRQFQQDKCILRASALTFFSLLSIVPVVAMAFGIAKGFGMDKKLEAQLVQNLQGQEEVVSRIIEFSNAMLNNTKGGVIAGIGVGLLFWTIIKMLGNIESAFNDIWGVKTARKMGRKFADYLSFMMICPIFLIASGSITVFVVSQVTHITETISFLGVFAPIIFALLKLTPLVMVGALFSFIYSFMPNTNVKLPAAILGGIIAGMIYQLVQWAYITFQIGAANYGAIYGSFAALPLFLVWLQMSWFVVLFGAEVSFATQNVDTYEFEPDCEQASLEFKKRLALRMTHLSVHHFIEGNKTPLTDEVIADNLEMPIRLVRELLFELVQANVLAEIRHDDKTVTYQPARPIEEITLFYVLNSLEQRGISNIPIAESAEFRALTERMSQMREVLKTSNVNVALRDIAPIALKPAKV